MVFLILSSRKYLNQIKKFPNSRKHNEQLIKYYYDNTLPNMEFDIFRKQYYFLNTSRQTRLLGRWVKLSEENNQNFYLNFIKVTNKRLITSLENNFMYKIKSLYHKLIPSLYE